MHYVIYLPGVNTASQNALEAAGLPGLYRHDDDGWFFSAILENGPDGGSGTFAHRDPGQRYEPGRYTWTRCPTPGKNFWWGEADAPATALELARREQIPGNACVLGGDVWLVPNALLCPHDFGLGDDGQPQRVISAKYSGIAERAISAFGKARELLEKDGGFMGSHAVHLLDFLMSVLADNYRVFPEYILHRRLISESNWLDVFVLAVDTQAVIAIEKEVLQKKTALIPLG